MSLQSPHTFTHSNILAISDFSREDILHILDVARDLKESPQTSLLNGKLLGSCFFEPSTRTRLSFEAAMIRMGGSCIGFSDPSSLSTKKGESLHDSIKMMEQYVDVIVLRHPLEGAAQFAAEIARVPVINAGDGSNQHPTQTLLDLYTIQECQGRLDDLKIAMVGDLKYGRTVHSLAQACALFGSRLYFVAPKALEMPRSLCNELKTQGVKFSFHQELEEVLEKVDILYMTRVQAERMAKGLGNRLGDPIILTPEMLQRAKPSLKVLHPLPRVTEIDPSVDATPFAYYFQQARNGLWVRQALLSLVLDSQESKVMA